MPRFWILLVAVLIPSMSSPVMSAPSKLGHVLKITDGRGTDGLEDMEGYRNDLSPPSTADVKTEKSDGPRTIIMFGLMQWFLGMIKAIARPARNMYITMMPEITAFRCLSDSREFQNLMGFPDNNFEDETPRTSDGDVPVDEGFFLQPNPSDRGLPGEMYDSAYQQNTRSETLNISGKYNNPAVKNSVSSTTPHRTDQILRRIPRFVEEFASLLKDGQTMNCIMPYMRERFTRWLDS